MIPRLLALTAVLAIIAQLPSCHYYISAMPRIIVSSEPFSPPPPAQQPNPPPFQLGPD